MPSHDEPYQMCLSEQLQALRASFGRDLKRLTGADRRSVDSRCLPLQSTGPDAYVACLSRELGALRTRRGRAAAVISSDPAAGAPQGQPPPTAIEEIVPVPTLAEPDQARSSIVLWGGIGAALVAVGLCGWLYVGRSRRAVGSCRVCGLALPAQGDLCASCRREAAESLRRAASDPPSQPAHRNPDGAQSVANPGLETVARAAHATADQRQGAERVNGHTRLEPGAHGAEPASDEALQNGDAEQRAEEERIERARRAHDERLAEDRRRREDELKELSIAADAPPEVFNPYLVLGLPPDATPADVQAAYEAAREKYDPEAVAHLGAELRERFKRKASAAERARQLLTEARSA